MFEEELLEKTAVCTEILQDARNELYLNMRFLDVALSSLMFQPTFEINTCATDGNLFYYEIPYLIRQYQVGNVMVNRAYLHSIFHCLFGHVWKEAGEDEMLWNLSCDIAMEYVIDSLPVRCLRLPPRPYRRAVYNGLEKKLRVLTAEGIYRLLAEEEMDPRKEARLIQEFMVDNHSFWENDRNQKNGMPNENQWQDIREKMETELQTFSKEAAEDSKSLLEQLSVENRERYDYREFLRKFCVLKEEMLVDMDSFDYIFYNYGMELYGNMPLIEPQETKEVNRIEDFVIAVDTSMSCKKELIRKFLEETYSVLSQSESFYRKFRVHIIQCDERIQSDVVITNERELRQYMEHFEIRGLGGTDFRPVFTYVDQLMRKKQFSKLKGLIYFTDGYGRYPLKKPVYDTAFVFLKEDYLDVDVPPWAIKLILGEEDLVRES